MRGEKCLEFAFEEREREPAWCVLPPEIVPDVGAELSVRKCERSVKAMGFSVTALELEPDARAGRRVERAGRTHA